VRIRLMAIGVALAALLTLSTAVAADGGYAGALVAGQDQATAGAPPFTPPGPPDPLPGQRPDNTPPVTVPDPQGGGPPSTTPPGVIPTQRPVTPPGPPDFVPAGPPSSLPISR
jgi:hypothetical protein